MAVRYPPAVGLEDGTYAGSAPIPYYSSRESLVATLPNDGNWIFVYCERQRAAADSLYRKLKEARFTDVAALRKGYGGWSWVGYPLSLGGDVANARRLMTGRSEN